MTRYATICCYFGKWPAHFQLWLDSCSWNNGIDFILVTDIPVFGYDVPRNVHIIPMTFEKVRNRIANQFKDLSICLDRPYKLCDFKVSYGLVFSDIFAGYEYWGVNDIDVRCGDVLSSVPRGRKYKKIFTWHLGCHLLWTSPGPSHDVSQGLPKGEDNSEEIFCLSR